jgi:hypothetical protein
MRLRVLVIPLVIPCRTTPGQDRTQWTHPPDLTCTDSTSQHQMDPDHQPTDVAVGGSNPSRRANLVDRPVGSAAQKASTVQHVQNLVCLCRR